MSNAERTNAIKNIVSKLSTTKQLETIGSPQNRAFNWLTKRDSLFVCPDDRQSVRQRYTLSAVYFAVEGDNWDKCSRKNRTCSTVVGGKLRSFPPYLSSDDVCKWFGVSCDGAGAITHVLLGGNEFFVGVNGDLPDELFSLPKVKGMIFLFFSFY